jgi:hypothetical protein
MHVKKVILASVLTLGCAASSRAGIFITEVDPTGSSNAIYGADWFELTNTGASAVDITGWKIDDNSQLFANAVAIRGVTSIAAGQSVVFVEGNATGTTDTTLDANFETAWFGANVPAGFTIGNYGGTGVGLSATADGVNIFDSAGNPITGVSFGASTSGVTFDNAADAGAGVNLPTTPPTISTLSVAGTNGAFTSPDGEIGSPGVVAHAVPEPAAIAVFGIGGLTMLTRRRKMAR